MVVPIEQILTWETAAIVAAALLVSLVGATVAVTVRHLTAQNWVPHLQDIWYYIFSASIAVTLSLLGADTATLLGATTGINTPVAILKTTIDKYTERKSNGKAKEIQELKRKLAELEGRV